MISGAKTKTSSYETQKLQDCQDIVIYTYKVKNRLEPKSLMDIFNRKPSIYGLRTNSDFNLPRFNAFRYGTSDLCYGQNWVIVLRTCLVKLASKKRSVK